MDHLLSISRLWSSSVANTMAIVVVAMLAITPLVVRLLHAGGHLSPAVRTDIMTRWRTWLVLAPAAVISILLCPLSAMLMVAALALLCYREFARATGVFRARRVSIFVVLATLALFAACIDNWYAAFVAIAPLTIAVIAGACALEDHPEGYLQRVALGSIGFLLFGFGLMHLAFIANDADYRPILMLVIASAQASDIAGFVFGKSFGTRHLFPNTSPRKTLAGHLGGLVVVTGLVAWVAHLIFLGTAVDHPITLLALGVTVALGAQIGDLVLGSIKRDLGVKDLAVTLPGHGGFTDRCNSLLLVAPVFFHFIGYFRGFGLDRLPRVLSQ